VDGLKDRPKCPPPRQYHADIQARLLVLACQNRPRLIRRVQGRPTGASRTWLSMWPPILNLAWVVPAGAPSASFSSGTRFAWTVFSTWMNDRDPEFATKAVAVIELLLSPPTDGPLSVSTRSQVLAPASRR